MPVIEEAVACMLVGAMSLLFGIWQTKTKSAKYIHPKYLKNVHEEDRPRLAALVGVGIMFVGVGCLLLGPALLYKEYPLGVYGVIFLFAGLFLSLFSIRVFNGKYD